MNINSVNQKIYTPKHVLQSHCDDTPLCKNQPAQLHPLPQAPAFVYKSYFPNISFKGAYSNLKKMTALSPDGTEQTLKKEADGSYLVDPETVSKMYYGKNAENFLNKTSVFEDQTQVICPNDGELLVEADGKEIPVVSDGAIVLEAGKEAKIKVIKGNPLVITSKRPPVWYEEYTNKPKTKAIQEHAKILRETYQHFYSGQIKISDIGDETASKLVNSGKAEYAGSNHIEMKAYYAPDFMADDLSDILTEDELAIFKPRYKNACKLKQTTKYARRMHTDGLDPELAKKLEDVRLIVPLGEKYENMIYWRKLYAEETQLRNALQDRKFTKKEQDEIIKFWKENSKIGFDFTGLQYLGTGIGVYSLKDRINNITGGSQHWDTTAFIVSSTDESSPSPYIGVSEKHSDIDYKEPQPYKQLRAAEMLHSHPAELNWHQTEIYLITEGAGALTVIENGKPKTVILKQGEGFVLQPGVKHCVSAFKGKYEHLVCQIPSIFQYGTASKINQPYPEGYSEAKANQAALEKLKKITL